MLRLERNKDVAEHARFRPDCAFAGRADAWLYLLSDCRLILLFFGLSGNTW